MAVAIKEPKAAPKPAIHTCRHCGYQWQGRRHGPNKEYRVPVFCPHCRKLRPVSEEYMTHG